MQQPTGISWEMPDYRCHQHVAGWEIPCGLYGHLSIHIYIYTCIWKKHWTKWFIFQPCLLTQVRVHGSFLKDGHDKFRCSPMFYPSFPGLGVTEKSSRLILMCNFDGTCTLTDLTKIPMDSLIIDTDRYPLVNVYKSDWSHGPVEIVDLPINFP